LSPDVAVYFPWLTVWSAETEAPIAVPPSGHIAGVYVRTDMERGVHKAPANEPVAGVIQRNVGGTGPLVDDITQSDQEILNPIGINCIRDFRREGRGILVWGARTTSSNGDWRYVPVRRLYLYLKRSLEIGTQWVVFEPNDEPTWTGVTASVSGFLNVTWRNGALMGSTPDQAYFVRCDRTTMTQDDIDNGRLIIEIGFAPVKPAEFIILRIMQKTADGGN
jgi:phage tail sheath protein FI